MHGNIVMFVSTFWCRRHQCWYVPQGLSWFQKGLIYREGYCSQNWRLQNVQQFKIDKLSLDTQSCGYSPQMVLISLKVLWNWRGWVWGCGIIKWRGWWGERTRNPSWCNGCFSCCIGISAAATSACASCPCGDGGKTTVQLNDFGLEWIVDLDLKEHRAPHGFQGSQSGNEYSSGG